MDEKRFLDPSGASEAADKFGSPALEDEKIEAVPKVMSTPESDASIRNSSGASTPQNMFTEDDDVTADQLNEPKLPRKNPSTIASSSEDVASELEDVRVEQVSTEAKLSALQRDLDKLRKKLDEINSWLNEEKRKNIKLENENKDLQLQNRSKIEKLELEKSAIEKRLQTALVTIKNLEQELEDYLIDYSSRGNRHRVEEPGKPRINVDVRGDVLSCGFHFGRLMPLWVQEYIGKDEENLNQDKPQPRLTSTTEQFKYDPTWHNNCLTDNDYKDLNARMYEIHQIKNMYEKGHMARKGNYSLSNHREETCCNFNICPQHRGLNHGAWLTLENLVLEWAKECDHGLWICCGPMWIGNCTLTIGKGANAVPVPSHYYKVVLLEKDGKKEIRAFQFPNEKVEVSEPDLKAYMVFVEEVEHYLGCEIFPKVERDTLLMSDWQPTFHQV